ncbi:MAG: glycine zipper 2TM domain-containing protein [Holosporales bacterium]|nr:glycine zipper 2TM domain-containing protein [Holosporales bacterium]
MIALFLSGCAADYSGNTYQGGAVGEVSRSEYGTVVQIRDIKIKVDKSAGSGALVGGTAGAVGGALVGSAFDNKMVGAAVGAAAGALGGHAIQNRDQKGKEYTIRLDNGHTVTITQGLSPQLSVGQRVIVIDAHKGRGRVIPG